MHPLQVAMLGPRSVGKTSLLAAMYQQFQSNVAKSNLQLGLDAETAAVLQERLIDLKNLIRGGEGVPFTSGEIGVDSMRKRSFVFRIGKPHAQPSMELRFKDYPGGYLGSNAVEEQRAFVQHLVFNSAAVVIPVDAPSLMEANSMWNEYTNRPMEVTEFLKTGYEGLKDPRLVIFAPTKCEKYMSDPLQAEDLARRVKEEYAEVLAFLSQGYLRERVAVAITPVQTVGDVVFSRLEMVNGRPRFLYRPRPAARYSPQDSEQPLRYLLSFLTRLHLEQRSWGALNFVRDLFGLDTHFRNAAREFAAGCKTSEHGFELIQGRELLSLEA